MPDMGVCAKCQCSLSVKINLTPEQVKISNEGRDIEWPTDQACWQRELLVSKT